MWSEHEVSSHVSDSLGLYLTSYVGQLLEPGGLQTILAQPSSRQPEKLLLWTIVRGGSMYALAAQSLHPMETSSSRG